MYTSALTHLQWSANTLFWCTNTPTTQTRLHSPIGSRQKWHTKILIPVQLCTYIYVLTRPRQMSLNAWLALCNYHIHTNGRICVNFWETMLTFLWFLWSVLQEILSHQPAEKTITMTSKYTQWYTLRYFITNWPVLKCLCQPNNLYK